MLPLDQARPIFVVGNSRSGTTMVARMLGQHPNVFTLRELHFFEELWLPVAPAAPLEEAVASRLAEQLLHRARVGYNLPFDRAPQLSDAAAIVAAHGPRLTAPELYWCVMAEAARTEGAQRPCEQTPRNVHFLDAILEVFPGCRVVVVVRDPRDVVLSQRNWWRRGALGATEQTWRTSARRFLAFHPVLTTMLWRSGVRAGERVQDPRVLRVRFEDVIAAPEATMRQVCGHCDLDYRVEMLSVPRYNSSNRADPGGVGVDPTVVGRGSEALPPSERWVVQRLARREMDALGYEQHPVRPTVVGLVRLALTLVPKLGMALAANLGRSETPLRSLLRRLRA